VNVGNRYVSRGITMGTDIDCREGQTAPINVGCEIARARGLLSFFPSLSLSLSLSLSRSLSLSLCFFSFFIFQSPFKTAISSNSIPPSVSPIQLRADAYSRAEYIFPFFFWFALFLFFFPSSRFSPPPPPSPIPSGKADSRKGERIPPPVPS